MDKFDCYPYFENIHTCLKALDTFKFCRVSDKNTLEDLVNNSRTSNAFFCVDDTEDGQIMPAASGYVERRVYFVWILKKYHSKGTNAMISQDEAMNTCREIYRDIVSRLITDQDKLQSGLTYMSDRFPFWEIPLMLFPETAGLYFSITVDTPLSLCINPDKWK